MISPIGCQYIYSHSYGVSIGIFNKYSYVSIGKVPYLKFNGTRRNTVSISLSRLDKCGDRGGYSEVCKVHSEQDPVFYRNLSEKLEAIIQKYKVD
jgi:hypothetical protein